MDEPDDFVVAVRNVWKNTRGISQKIIENTIFMEGNVARLPPLNASFEERKKQLNMEPIRAIIGVVPDNLYGLLADHAVTNAREAIHDEMSHMYGYDSRQTLIIDFNTKSWLDDINKDRERNDVGVLKPIKIPLKRSN